MFRTLHLALTQDIYKKCSQLLSDLAAAFKVSNKGLQIAPLGV